MVPLAELIAGSGDDIYARCAVGLKIDEVPVWSSSSRKSAVTHSDAEDDSEETAEWGGIKSGVRGDVSRCSEIASGTGISKGDEIRAISS